MQRRKHVELIRIDKGSCLGTELRFEMRTGTGLRVNRLDKSWIPDCHVYEAARRIEERRVRNSGKRPLAALLSSAGIEFQERAAIASDVEESRSMIDIDPVCALRRKNPALHLVQGSQETRGSLPDSSHTNVAGRAARSTVADRCRQSRKFAARGHGRRLRYTRRLPGADSTRQRPHSAVGGYRTRLAFPE